MGFFFCFGGGEREEEEAKRRGPLLGNRGGGGFPRRGGGWCTPRLGGCRGEGGGLSGPISRDIAILSLRYPILRDTF